MKRDMYNLFRAHSNNVVPGYMLERWCASHEVAREDLSPLSEMTQYIESREMRQSVLMASCVGLVVGIVLWYVGSFLQSTLFMSLSALLGGVSGITALISGVMFITLTIPTSWKRYFADFNAFMVNFEIADMSTFKQWPFPQGLQAYVEAKFMDTKVQISLNRNSLMHRWALCFGFAEPWDIHVRKFKPDYL